MFLQHSPYRMHSRLRLRAKPTNNTSPRRRDGKPTAIGSDFPYCICSLTMLYVHEWLLLMRRAAAIRAGEGPAPT